MVATLFLCLVALFERAQGHLQFDHVSMLQVASGGHPLVEQLHRQALNWCVVAASQKVVFWARGWTSYVDRFHYVDSGVSRMMCTL